MTGAGAGSGGPILSGTLPGGVIPPAAGRGRPDWLDTLAQAAGQVAPERFSKFLPPAEGGRQSAVLILFGPHAGTTDPLDKPGAGESVLLIERAHDMRSHAGQVAFPGGALDPDDAGDPVFAALREAAEETGLDPAGVEPVVVLPQLFLPPSGFVVTPIVGWWQRPSPVWACHPEEVAEVVLAPVDHLLDPASRHTVVHHTGYRGVAFDVGPLVVWGFTGGLLSTILDLAGLTRPWNEADERDLPERFARGSRYRHRVAE